MTIDPRIEARVLLGIGMRIDAMIQFSSRATILYVLLAHVLRERCYEVIDAEPYQ